MQHELRYRKGDTIGGRYLVHKALAGGMGEVYLCLDLETNLPYALKSFQSRYLASPRARAYFEREAGTWVALEKHPNVVRCFYLQKVDNTPFLLLEWVVGEKRYGTDLRQWLKGRGPSHPQIALQPQLALQFAIDVSRALGHAAAKVPGFVHCDVKPENVLVAQGRLAKLTDFGLAKLVREAGLVPHDEAAPAAGARWQVSSAGGTPPYMAPEQWRGDPVDARTDVYAVGCLLYELLSGRWPFEATRMEELKRQHLEAAPPGLAPRVPGAPRARLDALMARCLAKERGERYASAWALQAALERLYETWHGAPPRNVPGVEKLSAGDHNNRGNTYNVLGRHAEAPADYDAAIRIDPKHAAAYSNRGNSYAALGRHAEALDDYDAAIRIDPKLAAAYANRGNTYKDLGRHAEALADYSEAIRVEPNLAGAYSNRGRTYAALGRHAEALADHDEAIRLDPDDALAYSSRAATYCALRRHAEALDDYSAAIRIDPNYGAAYRQRGITYASSSRHAEALDDYRAAIRIDPNDVEAYYHRGLTCHVLGRHAEALVAFDAALRIDPGLAKAHSNRGATHATMRRYTEALADHDAAVHLDPGAVAAHIQRGLTYGELGRHAEALADFSEAIGLDPNHASAYSLRGFTYAVLGEHAKALADYDAAIRIDPNRAKGYFDRGNAYHALGRYAEALAEFDAAIRLDRQDPRAYSNRGAAYSALGRRAEALADFEAAIRLDPNYGKAYVNKGVIHTERGEWDDALRAFETAARLGEPAGAQYAVQARQARGLPPEPATPDPMRQALEAFLEADTRDELRGAVGRHPILAEPDFFVALEQIIAQEVPTAEQQVFRQRLDWLRKLVPPNAKS
jgi:tetratricopeptide (TPR) repeat protein